MKRPFVSKRPIGPFVESSRSAPKEVVITTDFSISKVEMRDGSMQPEPRMAKQKMNLHDLVDKIAEPIFFGQVKDVRVEDHAVDGDDGIRVVYGTEVNATFKNNIDGFEDNIKERLRSGDIHNEFGKITIVAE